MNTTKLIDEAAFIFGTTSKAILEKTRGRPACNARIALTSVLASRLGYRSKQVGQALQRNRSGVTNSLKRHVILNGSSEDYRKKYASLVEVIEGDFYRREREDKHRED